MSNTPTHIKLKKVSSCVNLTPVCYAPTQKVYKSELPVHKQEEELPENNQAIHINVRESKTINTHKQQREIKAKLKNQSKPIKPKPNQEMPIEEANLDPTPQPTDDIANQPIRKNYLEVIINNKEATQYSKGKEKLIENTEFNHNIPSNKSNSKNKEIILRDSQKIEKDRKISLQKISNTLKKMQKYLEIEPQNHFKKEKVLDSLQYLIINLIERIKDYQHTDIPQELNAVREVLVKDFYVIEDTSIDINLPLLMEFAYILSHYATSLVDSQINRIEINFSTVSFVQFALPFLNHGLPSDCQEKDRFYIKDLERSLIKLEEYKNAASKNISDFKDAISYHISRIGKIRNKLSAPLKEINSYLFEEIIPDNFRKKGTLFSMVR